MKRLVCLKLHWFNCVPCQACNFIKKRLQHKCFPVNIAKFLRTPILWNTATDYSSLNAKLEAYGFSYSSLKYLKSYLDHRRQIINISNDLTSIFKGVPQGSILGLLLLDVFLSDLFLSVTNSHLSNSVDTLML